MAITFTVNNKQASVDADCMKSRRRIALPEA
jgi:hypothetical protein